MNDVNYKNSKELQAALSNFVQNFGARFFVTLNFNCWMPVCDARQALSRFHSVMDKKQLGRNFYKRKPEERTFFIALPEHFNSNFHYHLLMNPPPQSSFGRFRYFMYARRKWRTIHPGGSIDVKEIYSLNKLSVYCCKETWKKQNYGNFVISNEFIKGASKSK